MQSSGPQAAMVMPLTALIPSGATAFPGDMQQIGAFPAHRIDLDRGPRVHHLPTWKTKDDPTRIRALRQIALTAGRDPRLATLAVSIVRGDPSAWGRRIAGAPPRNTRRQSELLLKWVQDLYYVNEPGERLQDPLYTAQKGYGDCDDLAMLLAALLESLRIPWRYVLSGRTSRGKMVRWIEGQPRKRAKWAHIYLTIGDRPFQRRVTKRWSFAEPTVRNVPLGWDVVQSVKTHGKVILPELAGIDGLGDAAVLDADKATKTSFWSDVSADVKDRLRPRSLVPILIVGMVTGYLADTVRQSMK